MDARTAAPTLGIAGCLLTLAVLAVPYAIADAPAVTAYYNAGAITAWAVGLFAAVGVIVFAAGREERSDPALTAGAALVLGAFAFAIALAWALTVRVDALGADHPWFSDHRWALAAVSGLIPAGGAWYARALRLL